MDFARNGVKTLTIIGGYYASANCFQPKLEPVVLKAVNVHNTSKGWSALRK